MEGKENASDFRKSLLTLGHMEQDFGEFKKEID
jgi:hypothetical protein